MAGCTKTTDEQEDMVKRWSIRAGLALVLLISLGLVACGSRGKKEATSTAAGQELASTPAGGQATTPAATAAAASSTTATAATVSEEVKAKIRAAGLKPEDMPIGFSLQDEPFRSPEEMAQAEGSPGDAIQRNHEWGAQVFYEAVFAVQLGPEILTKGGLVTILSGIYLFDSSKGTEDALAWFKSQDQLESLLWPADEQTADLKVERISFDRMGQDSQAWRVTNRVSRGLGDTKVPIQVLVVMMREGKALGILGVAAMGDADPDKVAPDLARKLAARLEEQFD
jgi:hypothetical protein